MNILAIDPATKCGWAFNNPSDRGGVFNLAPKSGSSQGMKLIKMRAYLDGFLKEVGKIDLVVYEKPAGRFMGGVISVAEVVAVIKMFCEENGIDYTSYRPTEIKQFATGKGNSGKTLMLEAAKKNWPNIKFIDDNMADAMWILQKAKSDLIQ